MKTFDVIVIGVGSMGSAACWQLASRGLTVLGLEQFDIVHERGSHTGQSRIIRKAYYEHPDYVPLLQRAYELWEKIEQLSGSQLYFPSGIIYMGEPDHPVMKGIAYAASTFQIPLEQKFLKGEKYFTIPPDFESLYEPEAGFVLPEKTIHSLYSLAKKSGAVIREREPMLSFTKSGDGFFIKTIKDEYYCSKLVFTAGAWAHKLLRDLPPLNVTRQLLAWCEPKNPHLYDSDHFPCWFVNDTELGIFYGFPYLKSSDPAIPSGIKIARHVPAKTTDPDLYETEPDPREMELLMMFISGYFPALERIIATKNCLYTNSADEHFIVDTLLNDPDIIVATGFSGHGFKFVPVIGELIADLVIHRRTELPADFLKLDRFA